MRRRSGCLRCSGGTRMRGPGSLVRPGPRSPASNNSPFTVSWPKRRLGRRGKRARRRRRGGGRGGLAGLCSAALRDPLTILSWVVLWHLVSGSHLFVAGLAGEVQYVDFSGRRLPDIALPLVGQRIHTGCCANWCCFFSENGRYCCVKWCCFVAGSSPCCVK